MEEYKKASDTTIKVTTSQPDKVEEFDLVTIDRNIKYLEDLMRVHQVDLDIWLERKSEALKLGIV